MSCSEEWTVKKKNALGFLYADTSNVLLKPQFTYCTLKLT